MDLSQDQISKKLSQQNYQCQGLLWCKDNWKKAKKVGVDRGMWVLEAKIHLGPEEQKMHFEYRHFASLTCVKVTNTAWNPLLVTLLRNLSTGIVCFMNICHWFFFRSCEISVQKSSKLENSLYFFKIWSINLPRICPRGLFMSRQVS